MKKILFFILCLFSCTSVYAKDKISSMKIYAYINEDGSADINEIWNTSMSKSSDYTEFYKQYYNLIDMDITDLKVSMDGNEFTTLNKWDVNSSFSNKSYKAGINKVSEGLEICFGLTSYGTHTYNISYHVTNFVKQLNDSQLVYFAFLGEKWDFPVDEFYVKVYSNNSFEDTLDVWGYGYKGYAYVYNGYIEMSTDGSLGSDEYAVLLIKFPSGTYNTTSRINKDFSYYLDLAEDGARKHNLTNKITSFISKLFTVIIPGFFTLIVIFIGAVVKVGTRIGSKNVDVSKVGKTLPKDVNNFREIPCKNIFRGYHIANTYHLSKKHTDFLGCMMLKWINEGKMTIKDDPNNKNEKMLVMQNGISFDSVNESTLYGYMLSASKDGNLEKNEFKKYCDKHYQSVLNWFNTVMDEQTDKFTSEGYLVEEKGGLFGKKYVAQTQYYEEAIKVKGLKNFLLSFTNVKDKTAIEVKLLNEYLVYAQLFGIAKEVAKEFKRLYPDELTDATGRALDLDDIYFLNMMSSTGVSAATTARSRAQAYSSGGGGFSSSGGGGGSFGGGGGGGAR